MTEDLRQTPASSDLNFGTTDLNFGTEWNRNRVWIGTKSLKTWWPGTELNRRRQPFQNSPFQCFQQLQRLPRDCQTLENTGKAEGSWVIAVGDSRLIG
jgi:hypothetical protein